MEKRLFMRAKGAVDVLILLTFLITSFTEIRHFQSEFSRLAKKLARALQARWRSKNRIVLQLVISCQERKRCSQTQPSLWKDIALFSFVREYSSPGQHFPSLGILKWTC